MQTKDACSRQIKYPINYLEWYAKDSNRERIYLSRTIFLTDTKLSVLNSQLIDVQSSAPIF